MTPEEIKTALTAAKKSPIATEWVKGFSTSIIEQLNKGRKLSEKQMFHVNKIIAENTGEALVEAEQWESTYREKYESDAKYLCSYYAGTSYFRGVVQAVMQGVVPPRRGFLKMYGNKYAKKILAERDKPPRFDSRIHVVGNSKFRRDKVIWVGGNLSSTYSVRCEAEKQFENHGGFIVGVENAVYSAAKGNKVYKILPVAGKTIIKIEERFLKKARR
jgi:hypothetical protein